MCERSGLSADRSAGCVSAAAPEELASLNCEGLGGEHQPPSTFPPAGWVRGAWRMIRTPDQRELPLTAVFDFYLFIFIFICIYTCVVSSSSFFFLQCYSLVSVCPSSVRSSCQSVARSRLF